MISERPINYETRQIYIETNNIAKQFQLLPTYTIKFSKFSMKIIREWIGDRLPISKKLKCLAIG